MNAKVEVESNKKREWESDCKCKVNVQVTKVKVQVKVQMGVEMRVRVKVKTKMNKAGYGSDFYDRSAKNTCDFNYLISRPVKSASGRPEADRFFRPKCSADRSERNMLICTAICTYIADIQKGRHAYGDVSHLSRHCIIRNV